MDITEFENSKINDYIKNRINNNDIEFEVRFFNDKIDESIFNNILNYLTFNEQNGGLDLKFTAHNSLCI